MRPIIAKYIKKWFEDGHEIGNHSWSHPVNFGELSQSEIKEEIFNIISKFSSYCKKNQKTIDRLDGFLLQIIRTLWVLYIYLFF